MTNKNANTNKNKELHTKGSEWKKWDLHIHTPYSGDYGDAKGNPTIRDCANFIKELEESDLDCIGINDYSIICGYEKVLDYQKKGRLKGKKIFPVIEYRIDKYANDEKWKNINLHIIINPEKENIVNFIKESIIQEINKDYSGKKKQNINSFADKEDMCEYVIKYSNVEKILKDVELRNDILIGLGYNEWGSLNWHNKSNDKEQFIKDMDFLFCASEEETVEKRYSKTVMHESFKKLDINKNIMFINASDKHNFKDKDKTGHCNDFSKYSFIKADCFEGLKLALIEKDRISYKKDNPYLIDKKDYLVENISLEKNDLGKINILFNLESKNDKNTKLEFNEGLIAVIGNKGSGKSCLANMIVSKFDDAKSEIDKYKFFEKDNIKIKTNMHTVNGEYIDYFSQNKIATFSEPDNEGLKKYLATIMDNYKNNEGMDDIEKDNNYDTKIKKLNKDILEDKNILEEIKKINDIISNLDKLNKDIDNQEKAFNENENYKVYQNIKQDLKNINNETNKYKELGSKIENIKEIIEIFVKNIKESFVTPIQDNINEIEKYTKEHKLNKIDLNIENFKIDGLSILELFKKKIENKFLTEDDGILVKIIKENNTKITEMETEKATIEQDIQNKEKDLGEIATPEYLKTLRENRERYNIELETYKSKCENLEERKKKLGENKENRKKEFINYVKGRFLEKDKNHRDVKINFKEYIKELKKEISDKYEYKDEYKVLKQELDRINIVYQIEKTKQEEFSENLANILNLTKSSKLYHDIVDQIEKIYYCQDIAIIENIYDCLIEKLEDKTKNIEFKQTKTEIDLYNVIFDIKIIFNYQLMYKGRDFDNLSGGQKGTLLTIAILLLDKKNSNKILVIDQPEDQLDNNTVNTILVPAFKFAKKKRQIFLITHNANLVINADAEQIIVAEDKKEDKKVILTYKAGSLEDEDIKSYICNILEGGEEAFKKRRLKYNIK
jgi:ABC-type lipoprotein export system ATPase subunit